MRRHGENEDEFCVGVAGNTVTLDREDRDAQAFRGKWVPMTAPGRLVEVTQSLRLCPNVASAIRRTAVVI
jgi:hypothetical protein